MERKWEREEKQLNRRIKILGMERHERAETPTDNKRMIWCENMQRKHRTTVLMSSNSVAVLCDCQPIRNKVMTIKPPMRETVHHLLAFASLILIAEIIG